MAKPLHTLVLVFMTAAVLARAGAEEASATYQLRGQNPDGKSGYTGTVSVSKQGDTLDVHWFTGTSRQETVGFGVKGEGTVGVGYGGESLYSVGVYELQDKKIHATWALTSKPGTVGNYNLKGSSAFTGGYKFADGSPGTVTMKPLKGGAYKMVWDLAAGRYEGIGVKIGNALVAVAGAPGANIGVAGYQPKGSAFEGVWTTASLGGVGKENWTPAATENAEPASNAPAPAEPAAGASGQGLTASRDGKTITFDGDDYLLKGNQSAPGQPTSELREYLQQGEDWDGYRKMVALRMMSKELKGDASTIAQGTLARTKKDYPDAYTRSVVLEPDHAVVVFVIVTGKNDAELNLWDFRRTANGFPSAQFVFRDKPPFDTPEKFKAERDKHLDSWLNQLAALSSHAEDIMVASAEKAGDGAPVAENKPNAKVDDQLAEAIAADVNKCGAVAEKFITLLKTGDTKGAVTLMSDGAFKKVSRNDFTAGLTKSSKALGALQTFSPDKSATDFGVVDGVMTFTFQGDAQYANGSTRETLRFIRNNKGEVEFVGYNRAAK